MTEPYSSWSALWLWHLRVVRWLPTARFTTIRQRNGCAHRETHQSHLDHLLYRVEAPGDRSAHPRHHADADGLLHCPAIEVVGQAAGTRPGRAVGHERRWWLHSNSDRRFQWSGRCSRGPACHPRPVPVVLQERAHHGEPGFAHRNRLVLLGVLGLPTSSTCGPRTHTRRGRAAQRQPVQCGERVEDGARRFGRDLRRGSCRRSAAEGARRPWRKPPAGCRSVN